MPTQTYTKEQVEAIVAAVVKSCNEEWSSILASQNSWADMGAISTCAEFEAKSKFEELMEKYDDR